MIIRCITCSVWTLVASLQRMSPLSDFPLRPATLPGWVAQTYRDSPGTEYKKIWNFNIYYFLTNHNVSHTVKYTVPLMEPLFLPTGSSNTTPTHFPTANVVIPTYEIIPGTFFPLTSTFWPIRMFLLSADMIEEVYMGIIGKVRSLIVISI